MKAANVFISLLRGKYLQIGLFLQLISHKILVGFLHTAGCKSRRDNDYLINFISCPGQPVAYAHS